MGRGLSAISALAFVLSVPALAQTPPAIRPSSPEAAAAPSPKPETGLEESARPAVRPDVEPDPMAEQPDTGDFSLGVADPGDSSADLRSDRKSDPVADGEALPAATDDDRALASDDDPAQTPATDIGNANTVPGLPDPGVESDAVPVLPPAWEALAEDDFTFQSCLLGLTMLGVKYDVQPALTSPEDRDCGIARPVSVSQIQPGIEIRGDPLMRCDAARQLALWTRAELLPAASRLPGSPRPTALLPGSTSECRARVGGSSDRLSEHALGNAFDLSAIEFDNGEAMTVSPKNDSGTIEEAFQKAIRYGGCLYFTTVLGPGSNASHDDHLHFDIIARKNGWRLCE